MQSSLLARARRWAVVVAAFLGGGAGALALHRGEAGPMRGTLPQAARAELERARREQALLRAESTVRLWRVLDAGLAEGDAGP